MDGTTQAAAEPLTGLALRVEEVTAHVFVVRAPEGHHCVGMQSLMNETGDMQFTIAPVPVITPVSPDVV